MKKFLTTIAVISLFAGTTCAGTLAASDRGYISLSTSASAELAPDTAEIAFTVKTSDLKSMQKATVQNKEISDKVFGILKGMLNTSNGDYIKCPFRLNTFTPPV